MSTTIEVRGSSARALERLDPQRWSAGARRGLEAAGDDVVRAAQGNLGGHDRTGRIASSVSARVDGTGMDLGLHVGSDAPEALPVEAGRRSGARMPPPDAIAGWLSSTGGDPNAAFLVARTIGRRGIPATHFLSRAIRDSRDTVGQRIRDGIEAELR